MQPQHSNDVTRRHFLKESSLLLAGAALHESLPPAHGATPSPPPFNRFPRMVQEYYVNRVRLLDQTRRRRIEALTDKEEADAYVASVRERIRLSFGPEPPRTPLRPSITRIIDRGDYRIENIIFESRPGFLVTANLYLPKDQPEQPYPRPGIVATCGHSSNGKAAPAYQSFAQGLARQGYVVLIYDPLGQGERIQYPDPTFGSRVGIGVREHLYAGNQQFLVGEFIGSWRAWDGIRALDYLLTRPEVDPTHLGVTGNSGGGTMTTWLAGLDSRYTMAAPSCFVTSFRRNLENELPADTEQCPPRALALGLDHEDFLAALAPKPVIILAKERDYFDVRGSESAFQRLRKIYRLLGAEDQIALFTGPSGHGYSLENREAMYAWFHRATGSPLSGKEPRIELETDETLACAPGGQVAALNSKPVFEFTRERARRLQAERRPLALPDLQQKVKTLLRLEIPSRPPEFRILRQRRRSAFPSPRFTTYAIETEPGIQVVTYLLGSESHHSRPPKGSGRATLYVSHLSADLELRQNPRLHDYYQARPGAFFTCDLRGSGESQPDTCGENSFLQPYGSDYFYAIHGLMLDDCYPAQRTRDILRILQWLQQFGYDSCHLVAQGRGTVPATFAAFRQESVTALTLINPLESFQRIAESESYHWPLSSFVPDILSHFDLPDLRQAIAPRCPVKILKA